MNVLCQEVEGYTVMINRNDGSTREITQSMNFKKNAQQSWRTWEEAILYTQYKEEVKLHDRTRKIGE